ncbi:MAG: PQQ-dependent sugar dehydrogenase [Deinococcales bacterium]
MRIPSASRRTAAAALALAMLLSGAAIAQQLEPLVRGLSQPLAVASAGDGRLFVVEQAGTVRIVQDGALVEQPYLDLRGRISSGGERGLLGLAFAPDFASSGRLYVDYTDSRGASVLERFTARPGTDRVDPATGEVLLQVEQPYANHNGGGLLFGPDGFLYWGLGDGGSGGDPQGNGQNPATLLGTILRLDVSADGATAAPGNPFLGRPDARPEVFLYGLRNPWRFSFDRQTGDLYIGDVGQNAFEEIDRIPAGGTGGENLGWNVMEGDHCYRPPQGCDTTGLVLPIVTYPHAPDWGNSVTGGYVYRGAALPSLQGAYVFADFGSGRVWSARPSGDGSWRVAPLLDTGGNVSTFGEDDAGELLVVDYGAGALYRLVP